MEKDMETNDQPDKYKNGKAAFNRVRESLQQIYPELVGNGKGTGSIFCFRK